MKKILALALAIVLLTATAITAYAKIPEQDQIEAVTITPSLSFTGDTANCGVYVKGAISDSITVTLKLWRGSTLLATWTESGIWKISMSKTKSITAGYMYKVSADVSINGVAQPTKSISRYH